MAVFCPFAVPLVGQNCPTGAVAILNTVGNVYTGHSGPERCDLPMNLTQSRHLAVSMSQSLFFLFAKADSDCEHSSGV